MLKTFTISLLLHLSLLPLWMPSNHAPREQTPVKNYFPVSVISGDSGQTESSKGIGKIASAKKIISSTGKANASSKIIAKTQGAITPEYPWQSRVLGESGTAEVGVLISQDGKVIDAKILKSSGFKRLDQAAIDAVTSAKFIPALDGNLPIQSDQTLTFAFQLND